MSLARRHKTALLRFFLARILPSLYFFLFCLLGSDCLGSDDQDLLAQFYPYQHGTPDLPALAPGLLLTQANAQLAREVLPAEVLQLLIAGDIEFTIQPTTDLPPRQSYIEATQQFASGVELGKTGTLTHYRAGVPFPLLNPADPQAGEKLAWNVRYRDIGETFEMRTNTREVNASGQTEYYDRGLMRIRFGMHRPDAADNDAQWQARGIWMKTSFEMLSPSDREGFMNIRSIYDNDQRASEQWLYSPQNRRIRKAPVNYIAPIAGAYEVLLEEQPPFFFVAYLHDYDWKFLGTRIMLVPGFLKTPVFHFTGKHGWYPHISWELRQVQVLEASPRIPHPFGKRVFLIDQQTHAPLLILTYDTASSFIRLVIPTYAHPRNHPGSNGVQLPVVVGEAAIHYAKNRATLFTTGTSTIYNRPFAAQRFALLEMLRKGK